MTPQIGEVFLMEGEQYMIDEQPLHPYFVQLNHPPYFTPPSPTCWRGYYGKWEIKDGTLYLINFRGFVDNFDEVDLHYLFPNQEKVEADWYTGIIKVPQGKILLWSETLSASIYEEYLHLRFEHGKLISYEHHETDISLQLEEEIVI